MIFTWKLPLVILSGIVFVMPGRASAELLRNPSFENVPGSAVGQGLLPSDYSTSSGPFLVGADTYSGDGSYGLLPSDFGNFVGVVAADGLRFVAGGDLGGVREAFGQELSAALVPNDSYTLTALLHQSPNFSAFGGYELILSPSISFQDAGAVSLGRLAPTSTFDAWEDRSLSFIAPSNAALLPFLILAPYATNLGDSTYIGIDHLSLSRVPEPSTWALASVGIVGIGMLRRAMSARFNNSN